MIDVLAILPAEAVEAAVATEAEASIAEVELPFILEASTVALQKY